MQTNIEKLQQDMPLVFELAAKLRSEIAEATADYHIEVDRLRERTRSPEEFESAKQLAYRHLRNVCDPRRAELDAMTKRIADILAIMPPEPIFVPASEAQHPPALET